MQTSPFEFFRENMRNMMESRDSRFSMHKQHMDALSEAQKTAMDVVKSISQMQQQYMKQTFDSVTSMMKDMMTQGMGPDMFSKYGENIKKYMNHSIDYGVNLAEMLGKSQKDICNSMKDTVEDRVRASMKKDKKVN